MEKCVAKAEAAGARVVLVTPQAADVRKSGEEAAARRRLYAETMLAFGKEKGWPVVDTHHPLEALQREGEKADKDYSILKDKIHLTDPGYVAWGFFLYERLTPPECESNAVLTADGKVTKATRCTVEDVKAEAGSAVVHAAGRGAADPAAGLGIAAAGTGPRWKSCRRTCCR